MQDLIPSFQDYLGERLSKARKLRSLHVTFDYATTGGATVVVPQIRYALSLAQQCASQTLQQVGVSTRVWEVRLYFLAHRIPN
jgi:hypothetical protein